MTEREIPICARCSHKATMHCVDGEERRECMEKDCNCEQFEADLITLAKKPLRKNSHQRLTNWDIEEYHAKQNLLKKVIIDCLNEQGFDSAFNIPDYILADHMVESLWQFARSISDLAFHEKKADVDD